jgi:hypothetical protein
MLFKRFSPAIRNCSFCDEPLKQEFHAKEERFFCNELCADAGRIGNDVGQAELTK